LPNASDDICMAVAPCFAHSAFVSERDTIFVTSAFSRLTMAGGVFFGAINPSQITASYPGTPASESVGTSGMTAERTLPLVASARTLPALTCSFITVTASNIISTWPPRTPVRAPELSL
jgi:hypothetical protein